MANTINDLYLKYTNKVERTLENDRYFQYLYEIVQAGNNTLQQKNRVLHKVVDERWLTVVEEGITAIFNIVDKPRRFVTTTEEVVPVALAKKITADSVRHLSQNTQFIASDENGEIQPTRILNVTTEESFDLYENRFVYHLIQRLFAFVDKRTDVIFWSTGDETCNTMSMESKVDDAYEEISYKIEMTIKNRQSYVENDDDHMELFKRIDRVRRMSRTLRSSAFCGIMNGCARVYSPIQRTNLMMKDPDYRTCYKLWQFIESYDEVGYSIEEQDTALEFDEEYLMQMYIGLITNYTVFKSLLEGDPRHLTELASKKRKPVKPKFIKKIQEEIVDDYNIPDVEVRKVIVEEVTQAQLDAEKKLEEETARREELEASVSDLESSIANLEWQIDALTQQQEALAEQKAQAEAEKEALQKTLDAEKEERHQAEAAMQAAADEARLAAETAKQEAQAAIDAAKQEAEETKRSAARMTETAKRESTEAVQAAKQEAEEALNAEKRASEARAEALKRELEEKAAEAARLAARQLQETQEEAAIRQRQAEEVLEALRQELKETVAAMQKETEQAQNEAKDAKQEAQEAARRAEKAEQDRQKALEKVQEASLSHYIVQSLKRRREEKNQKDE